MFTLECGLLFLKLGGGFLLETIGGGELAFDLELGFAFATEFLGVIALAGFEHIDAALQFLDLPLVFLL